MYQGCITPTNLIDCYLCNSKSCKTIRVTFINCIDNFYDWIPNPDKLARSPGITSGVAIDLFLCFSIKNLKLIINYYFSHFHTLSSFLFDLYIVHAHALELQQFRRTAAKCFGVTFGNANGFYSGNTLAAYCFIFYVCKSGHILQF